MHRMCAVFKIALPPSIEMEPTLRAKAHEIINMYIMLHPKPMRHSLCDVVFFFAAAAAGAANVVKPKLVVLSQNI